MPTIDKMAIKVIAALMAFGLMHYRACQCKLARKTLNNASA
jgi:hypothetical protein